MDGHQILAGVPWAVAASAVTWAWQLYVHRDARRERREEKAAEVDKHRDQLAIELLSAARAERQEAREELDDVRRENRALQSLEQHFYHFEQALDHLEAILTAGEESARAVAERNATAFLARMRRLQRAKGNIQQEIQVVESAKRVGERENP
jgi:hypothetical protein